MRVMVGVLVVDVYPVGILEAFKHHRVRSELRHLKRHFRERDWNAIRNSFNGYLAEPREWPDGLRRCGSGWTKLRAMADLERRMRAVSK